MENYIKFVGKKPIVIIDYLQIIFPEDPRLIGREKIDSVIQNLKNFQIRNNLIVLAISSFNRDNYSQIVDLTSFKESGSIEFTADVVWGLQLAILNDEVFGKEKNTKEKREKVMKAKKEIPRKIELVCLKSRSSSGTYTCDFNYDPRYDLFTPANFQKYNNKDSTDKFEKLCASLNINT